MNQVFHYKVRDARGNLITGMLEAEDKRLVIDKLRQSGYIITSVQVQNAGLPVQEQLAGWRKVTLKDLAITSRQFATMISSGLTIIKCLQVLAQQTSNKKLREALTDILQEVEGGSSLSRALGKHGKIFPNLFVSMVRAGETGGILDVVMERLADYYEKEHELREKIKTATRYPLVISVFAMLVIVFMLMTVLPTFATMFTSMNAVMPLPTRILMGVSDLLRDYMLIWFFLVGVGIFLLVQYIKTSKGRERYERLQLKVPVLGELVKKIGIARVCRTLGTLVNSGVPILQALDVVSSVADNTVMQKALANVRESIREGEGISGPLMATGIFPAMVTQMIAVGEETGSLEMMLNKISDFYDKEVKNLVDSMTSLIEPFLIIFLAVVVGGIAISIILPIADLYNSLNLR